MIDRHPSAVRAAAVLARREIVRFARQPMRVIAALGTAVLLWFVIGGGLGGSMRLVGDGRYSAYLVPGVMTLVAMFAAIFSNIAAIDDRREGLLQAVLVAPAPRWAIAAGVIVGGAMVAWAQAMVLVPLAWFAGAPVSAAGAIGAAIALFTIAIALQALGLAFAWNCRDAGSFHAVMNLLFMPMWLLSDAFFPVAGAAAPLSTIIRLNPLSWCGEWVRMSLQTPHQAPSATAVAGSLAFAAGCVAAAIIVVSRSRRIAMTS